MQPAPISGAAIHYDHEALFAAADGASGLCTIVAIDGGFSRRVGAQLAVLPDGQLVGSLADGCLEKQLASDLETLQEPTVYRYGTGSPFIDFRLPCGGGLDILLDPAPDSEACRAAAHELANRRPATLALPDNPYLQVREFIPELALDIVGSGPEVDALATLATAAGLPVRLFGKEDLSLGVTPDYPPPDRWTATVLLFHDHEWEVPILKHALSGDGFYVGAQGGHVARQERLDRLIQAGLPKTAIERVKGPIGLIPSCRDPQVLAVSILADVFAEYEALRGD